MVRLVSGGLQPDAVVSAMVSSTGITREEAGDLLKSAPATYMAKDRADAKRVRRAILDAGGWAEIVYPIADPAMLRRAGWIGALVGAGMVGAGGGIGLALGAPLETIPSLFFYVLVVPPFTWGLARWVVVKPERTGGRIGGLVGTVLGVGASILWVAVLHYEPATTEVGGGYELILPPVFGACLGALLGSAFRRD